MIDDLLIDTVFALEKIEEY